MFTRQLEMFINVFLSSDTTVVPQELEVSLQSHQRNETAIVLPVVNIIQEFVTLWFKSCKNR